MTARESHFTLSDFTHQQFFLGTAANISRSSLITSVQQGGFAEAKEQTPGVQTLL